MAVRMAAAGNSARMREVASQVGFDGFLAVGGFADDRHIGLAVDDGGEAVADNVVIVDYRGPKCLGL